METLAGSPETVPAKASTPLDFSVPAKASTPLDF